MKKFLIVTSTVISIIIGNFAYSETIPVTVLNGSVSVSKELPQGFYGTWLVTAKLVETNNPKLFRNDSVDLWTLYKHGDVITLTNPESGATASITVEEVDGNRAVFTRQESSATEKEVERPEITVEGETFYGYDTLSVELYGSNGKLIKKNVVKYRIRGKKIMGSTLKSILRK